MLYQDLAGVLGQLEKKPKRLDKISILSDFFMKAEPDEFRHAVMLLLGDVFPPWDKRKLGVAAKLVIKAISAATGASKAEIERLWQKKGDLGIVARGLCQKKTQSTLFSAELTIKKVFANLEKVAGLGGAGAVEQKVRLLAELINSASPAGVQYIVRTVLEDMRAGVGESTIRDALAWAFAVPGISDRYREEGTLSLSSSERAEYREAADRIQSVLDITNDIGETAEMIRKNGIMGLKPRLTPGKPLKVMLVARAKSVQEAFLRVAPLALEYKYDGFRLQIHKQGSRVTLFTRRLENVTEQFPDVVKAVRQCVRAESAILDSEAVGVDRDTGKYKPFQAISQRIRRKHGIDNLKTQLPVEVNAFDIMLLNGQNLLDRVFRERRRLLESVIRPDERTLVLSRQLVTDGVREGEKFYEEALGAGTEGVIAKNLDSPYRPGLRVGFCVKVKPVMQSLELAVVAAEWGEGKRSGSLTSFTLACRDEDGNLREIGRVSTGIKELVGGKTSYTELTEALKPLVKSQAGRRVTLVPKVVFEVTFEEIQKSPTYSSGYALRFPRFVRLREERSIRDIDTLETVREMYRTQRHR